MTTKTVKKDNVKFVAGARDDGTAAHNLEWSETDGVLLLRIDLALGNRIMSSKGKPMISSTRGFIKIGTDGKFTINLNIMDKR